MQCKPSVIDEKCGWCAHHVPAGAHICGTCGAIRTEEETEAPLFGKLFDALGGAFLGAILGLIILFFMHEKNIKVLYTCMVVVAFLNVNNKMTEVKWIRLNNY